MLHERAGCLYEEGSEGAQGDVKVVQRDDLHVHRRCINENCTAKGNMSSNSVRITEAQLNRSSDFEFFGVLRLFREIKISPFFPSGICAQSP